MTGRSKAAALGQRNASWLRAPMWGPDYINGMIATGMVTALDGFGAKIAKERWSGALKAARHAQRPIPILRRIVARRTALVVVDMQRAFLDEGACIEVPTGRSIIPKINVIAAELRRRGGMVVFLRFRVGKDVGMLRYFEARSYLGPGRESPMRALRAGHPQFEIHPGLDVGDKDIVMDKTRFSAVIGSRLVTLLRRRAIQNVIVTGVTTDVCAGNTAEDLMQKDFHVVMVWDGTAALDRLDHELYLARIFGLYGDVMPTAEVVARLK